MLFEFHSRNKLGNYEWNVNCERIFQSSQNAKKEIKLKADFFGPSTILSRERAPSSMTQKLCE